MCDPDLLGDQDFYDRMEAGKRTARLCELLQRVPLRDAAKLCKVPNRVMHNWRDGVTNVPQRTIDTLERHLARCADKTSS